MSFHVGDEIAVRRWAGLQQADAEVNEGIPVNSSVRSGSIATGSNRQQVGLRRIRRSAADHYELMHQIVYALFAGPVAATIWRSPHQPTFGTR